MSAAADNIVRVLFEAQIDKFQGRVREITGGIVGLGDAGKRADKDLTFSTAQGGVLSLGEAGQKTGGQLRDAFTTAESGAERLERKINTLIKTFVIGTLVNKAKNLVQSYVREGQEIIKSSTENQLKLTQVMRNTMAAADDEIQSVIALADAQERLGVVSKNTQIAGAQELGTYLTKAETLKKLIPVMNDMIAQQYGANATQESAVNIATMMGKVMDGQVGALSRYGYAFDELQENVLKYGTEADRAAVLTQVITGSVGGMNQVLAQTDAKKLFEVNQALEDMKIMAGQLFGEVKTKVLGQILPSLQTLKGTLTDFANSGAWQRIADSLARIINLFLNLLDQVLQKAPDILEKVANGLEWIADNLLHIVKIVGIVQTALGALKAAGGLYAIIAGATHGNIPMIFKGIELLVSGIGNAVGGATVLSLVSGLDDGKKTNSSSSPSSSRNKTDLVTEMNQKWVTEAIAAQGGDYQFSPETLAAIAAAGGSGSEDKRTPFEIAMDSITEAFRSREDLVDSQISLAEARDDTTARKSTLQSYIDLLGEKLSRYMSLDRLVANVNERNILDTVRNRIMEAIARAAGNIDENTRKLKGEFNVPSGLVALSKYANITNDNSMRTRVVSMGDVTFSMHVEDLGAKTAAEVNQKMEEFSERVVREMMGHAGRGNT